MTILLLSSLAGFGGTTGEGLGATAGLLLVPGLVLTGQEVCLNTGLPAMTGGDEGTGEELCLVSDWHFLRVSS